MFVVAMVVPGTVAVVSMKGHSGPFLELEHQLWLIFGVDVNLNDCFKEAPSDPITCSGLSS